MISKIVDDIHKKCLAFRSMDRLVSSAAFTEAWKLDPDNIWIKFALINGDVETVEDWIEITLKKDIGEMSLRELRDYAMQLGIPNYTSYNKETLLIYIAQVQYARKAAKVNVGMPA